MFQEGEKNGVSVLTSNLCGYPHASTQGDLALTCHPCVFCCLTRPAGVQGHATITHQLLQSKVNSTRINTASFRQWKYLGMTL